MADLIKATGERPNGMNVPVGERVLDSATITGGGEWFVIGDDEIWYIQGNGADGDDWSLNNIETGGAGAIGWRIPFDPQTADDLRRLNSAMDSVRSTASHCAVKAEDFDGAPVGDDRTRSPGF